MKLIPDINSNRCIAFAAKIAYNVSSTGEEAVSARSTAYGFLF